LESWKGLYQIYVSLLEKYYEKTYSNYMAWESIDDKLKPPDPSVVKPFGNTPVNPLTGNPMYGQRVSYGGPSMGDSHQGHNATLLRHRLEDGKVKVYTDSKGVSERTEIQMPNGLVIVYKDYGFSRMLAHYKTIEILDMEKQPLGTIELQPTNRLIAHTDYRFFYERSEIGRGSGDIGLLLAQELVSHTIQPRSGKGTGVDGEIVTTIKNILNSKR
jgi:hypothetical protein